jgi:hypothetical protein
MNRRSTAFALKMFTRDCLREARRAELRGERQYAANLRDSVTSIIAENRSAISAPVDPETEKRLARTRAFAETIAAGFCWTQ